MKARKANKRFQIKTLIYLMLLVTGITLLSMLRGFYSDHQNPVKPESGKVAAHHCEVAKTCNARMDGTRVDLVIMPAAMPAMQPLDLQVTILDVPVRQVTFEFIGRDMPMDLGPVVLKPDGRGQNWQRYTGSAVISMCSTDPDMVWMARIHITTNKRVQTFLFELDTSRS